MIQGVFLIAAVSIFGFLAAGCATPIEERTKGAIPVFDDTNAVLIERTAKSLPLVSAFEGKVQTDENIIVVSLETKAIVDTPINYLIDDSLLAVLLKEGYRVLERDPDVLYHAGFERADGYAGTVPGTLPSDPLDAIVQGMKREGMDPAAAAELYTALREDYQDIRSAMALESADVIVAYRLLECGIHYETNDRIVEERVDGEEKTKSRLEIDLVREVRVRLFVRVIDARTGSIRIARIVETVDTDIKSFVQQELQTEGQLWDQVDEYVRRLERFDYTYFREGLPNQPEEIEPEDPNTAGEQLISLIEDPVGEAEESKSNILAIVFGIAAGALAITVIALLATM
ncbi:MAG: hypothetical protein ACLFRY_03965 [Spirochaetia bacterium]